MASPPRTPPSGGGRRAGATGQRGWSPLLLAIVGVPALMAVALGTLNPTEEPLAGPVPPRAAPLTAIDLICPSPLGPRPSLSVTQALSVTQVGSVAASPPPGDPVPPLGDPGPRLSNTVLRGFGADRAALQVPVGAVVEAAAGRGPLVLWGSGTKAPGLTAALSEERPRAFTGCVTPQAELWFSGLGAGPTHGSVVELINPDDANGVADVTIFSEEGIVDVPDLRGIAVPGNSSTLLPLAEILPQRGQLGARVTVSRGRLGVSVTDRNDELGAGAVSTEWLPAQPALSASNLLLGLPDAGQHQLVITNPGVDEATVSVQVITPTAPFVPTGVAQLQVPPESVGVLSLSDAVSEAVGIEGPDGLGLIVKSSTPVATSLRSLVAGDLSFTGPAEPVRQGWQLVPTVRKKDRATLVLWGGSEPATGTVRMLDQRGAVLLDREISLTASAADKLTLPASAAVVEVVSADGLAGALSVSGKRGSVVVAFGPVLTSSLIPDVRPALR